MKKHYAIPLFSLITASLLLNGGSAQAEIKKALNPTAGLALNESPIRGTARDIMNDSGQETISDEKTEIAQLAQNRRGRRTRKDIAIAPNYVGIGGSLGIIENVYGDFGAFALNSKLRFLKIIKGYNGGTDLSLRPSVIIGKDVSFAIPVTVDFRLPGFGGKSTAFVPYFGPGVNIFTGKNGGASFLVSGGVDFPIGDVTVNGQLNGAFEDKFSMGLTLGIGYNF